MSMTFEEINAELQAATSQMAKGFAQIFAINLKPHIEALKAAIDAAQQDMSRRTGYGKTKLYRHPKRRALRK